MGSNRGWINQQKRKKNLPTIKSFCEDAGFKYEFIHGYEWHIRIENVIDVFPTNKKWHWLPTGARGTYDDYEDLGRIITEYAEDK